MGGWRRWLLPDPPRRPAGLRALRVLCRSFHLLGLGLVLGVGWQGGSGSDHALAWGLAAGSGLLLLLLFSYESLAWFAELRGLAVLIKLGLLSLLPLLGAGPALALLAAITVMASVASHMPGRLRHLRPWG